MKLTNKILGGLLLSLCLIAGLGTTTIDAATKKKVVRKPAPKKVVKKPAAKTATAKPLTKVQIEAQAAAEAAKAATDKAAAEKAAADRLALDQLTQAKNNIATQIQQKGELAFRVAQNIDSLLSSKKAQYGYDLSKNWYNDNGSITDTYKVYPGYSADTSYWTTNPDGTRHYNQESTWFPGSSSPTVWSGINHGINISEQSALFNRLDSLKNESDISKLLQKPFEEKKLLQNIQNDINNLQGQTDYLRESLQRLTNFNGQLR